MDVDWLKQRKRIYWYDQYALNDHPSAFSKYDPDRIADELASIGTDIVALYAANQFSVAYYPSAIWPQHPNLNGRDYFGEVQSRLKDRGIKVVAYINWLESRHPEWNVVPLGCDAESCCVELPLASWADPSDPERRVQNVPGGQWKCACFNSPRRRQVVEVAREIAERYHPDAFHLDMLASQHVCVCEHCMPDLERICGTADITPEVLDAHWRDYIEWRCRSTASLIADVSAAVREHGVLTAHNAFAPLFLEAIFGQDERWLPSIDVFVSECFDAFLNPSSDLNATSLNVRWQHAIGKPSWILRTSAPIHYAHWSLTKAQWIAHAAACKANGGEVFGPCGVGALPDTTTSKRMLENVKAGFDFFMEDADLHDGATSQAKIALVFSWATRNRARRDDRGWCDEFMGWGRLLIEEHLPADIISAEDLARDADISRYDLIILPNAACMTESFCDTLRSYVRSGGSLLATGKSSLLDENGDARPDLALADVLGVSWQEEITGPFAIERPTEPEPAFGAFQKTRALGKTLCKRMEIDPAGPVSGCLDPPPTDLTQWPVAATHAFGNGKSAYCAFDIGRLYQQHGDEHIGILMTELIDGLIGRRQIEVTGPRTVETTLWRQKSPERTIVHLANRTVPWSLPTNSRQFTEVIPVHDFRVELECPYPNPRVTCRGAEVTWSVDGNALTAVIDKLDTYAAIVIEPGGTST